MSMLDGASRLVVTFPWTCRRDREAAAKAPGFFSSRDGLIVCSWASFWVFGSDVAFEDDVPGT
jgi:hypothetical protein